MLLRNVLGFQFILDPLRKANLQNAVCTLLRHAVEARPRVVRFALMQNVERLTVFVLANLQILRIEPYQSYLKGDRRLCHDHQRAREPPAGDVARNFEVHPLGQFIAVAGRIAHESLGGRRRRSFDRHDDIGADMFLKQHRVRPDFHCEAGLRIGRVHGSFGSRTAQQARYDTSAVCPVCGAEHFDDRAGLRIHECFRIDTATAEQALRENAITIKGKGGKVRTIPIEDERITTHLKKQLERTERGQKLLVPDGMPTDRAIHQLQLFIYSNRGDFQEDANRPLTFHGLRHTYAAEKYRKLIDGGMGSLDAHFAVSRLLGHERADVTDIYLASLPKEGRHGK